MKLKLLLLAGGLLAVSTLPGATQSVTTICVRGTSGNCYPVTSTAPFPVSATLNGFTPNGNVANLSASGITGSVALPSGTTVAVTNSGSKTVHINLSVGAGTAATTDYALVAGAAVGLTVGTNTYLNGITDTSTSTISIAGGSGLLTGYGGGSASGGGGAVTVANGADTAEGSIGDSAYAGSGNSTTIGLLKGLYTAAIAPLPQACTGNLPISQTTSTDLHTGSAKLYICSILIVSSDAENVSLVEGTGSVCATNTVALQGSTTAANGMALAANSGYQQVSPGYMFNTSVTANHLCLLQSGSGRLAGNITYIDK